MYTFEDFVKLPADPDEALEEFFKLQEAKLSKGVNANGWEVELDFVDALMAFGEVYEIEWLNAYRNEPLEGHMGDFFPPFLRKTKQKILTMQLRRARRVKTGAEDIFVLDVPAKIKIRKLVEAIKDNLGELTFSESKRAALYSKLNVFAAEVDQNLTRAEVFKSFAMDVFRACKTTSEEFKPLWERIDRVLDWLDKAEKWTNVLPPAEEKKALEAPKKTLATPSSKSDNVKE